MLQQELWKVAQHKESSDFKNYVSSFEVRQSKSLLNLTHTKSGDSITHVLARHGKLDMLKWVHEEWHVQLESVNLEGKLPLHEAAAAGHVQIVEYLLSQGVQIDPLKRSGWTPLMMACTKPKNLKLITLLANSGSNLHLLNKDGWNCFHIACRNADLAMIKFLAGYGGQLTDTISKNGRTPLHTAALHGRSHVVEFLINHLKSRTDMRDSCGSTPFMDAIRSGNETAIQIILDNYPQCYQDCNTMGYTCMHIAAEAGQVQSIMFLVNKCAMNVNCQINVGNIFKGQTPLHFAHKENNIDAVDVLKRLGASCEIIDSKGRKAYELTNRRTWASTS